MKTLLVNFTLTSLIKVLEHEGIDIRSIKMKLGDASKESGVLETTLEHLIDLSFKELEQIPKDSGRLDFLLENRVRVEKWNTSPATQFYYVMDEDGETLASELDGRNAVDSAIKCLEKIENDQT